MIYENFIDGVCRIHWFDARTSCSGNGRGGPKLKIIAWKERLLLGLSIGANKSTPERRGRKDKECPRIHPLIFSYLFVILKATRDELRVSISCSTSCFMLIALPTFAFIIHILFYFFVVHLHQQVLSHNNADPHNKLEREEEKIVRFVVVPCALAGPEGTIIKTFLSLHTFLSPRRLFVGVCATKRAALRPLFPFSPALRHKINKARRAK